MWSCCSTESHFQLQFIIVCKQEIRDIDNVTRFIKYCRSSCWIIYQSIFVTMMLAPACLAQSDLDEAPIHYESRPTADRVSQLMAKVEAGEVELKWDEKHGWLPSLLEALDVPRSSQTLVFSKTSQQIHRISPSRPRALYFNDEVYVGWVQRGDFVELAAVDPEQGAIFYTVPQEKEQAVIERDRGQCLTCHATSRTQSVPGFLVRSVFPKADGHPEFRLGTKVSDHATEFRNRFGGWYVTGQHGEMRHRGNETVVVGEDLVDIRIALDREAGANLKSLAEKIRVDSYLEEGSDIVALMLLEHQSQMHNFVTQASYETRKAIHHQTQMNRILERGDDFVSESTTRRINSVAEKLVKHLLFCEEFQLTSPVAGNEQFVLDFSEGGVMDGQGRSLRDLDLQSRLLKYPCSYLIYSPSFLALPEPVLVVVNKRIEQVLTDKDVSEGFTHLSDEDRAAIWQILTETHPFFQSE